MAEELRQSDDESGRTELPIERGFPIERVNEIAAKEGLAKRYYRPIYTMHKWWARRLGCVFRAVSLYTLLTDADDVTVGRPGAQTDTLDDFGSGTDIAERIAAVDSDDPERLWDLYPRDVTVEDTTVLDPFMGGGTSLVEASRFGAEVVGNDLSPVAWFVTKKELEAGTTDLDAFEATFERLRERLEEPLTSHYRTPCPNGDHEADALYYFWMKELDCVSCGNTVPLYGDCRVASGRYENDDQYTVWCPGCDSIVRVDDWQSETACPACGDAFDPSRGTVTRGGTYACSDCGQKHGIVDAINERGSYDERLYAVEYYCEHCDEAGREKGTYRGYKTAESADLDRFEAAKREWEDSPELREYVPSESIRPGWYTASTQFDGSAPGAHDILEYGYTEWTDLFNERQLLCLSRLLREIDRIDDRNLKEFFLLAVSDSLRYNNMMVGYHPGRNHIHDLFKTNSFDPPHKPTEANVWGSEYGLGSFTKMVEMIADGIEYARNPTERYVDEDGESRETDPFETPIGEHATLTRGDVRDLDYEDEFDAVITDPPYYDNVIYSELSDVFYVWQKVLLEDEYDDFGADATPRAESIVANPAESKDVEAFEDELRQAFETIRRALKDDGVLTFTYHHSDSESWGELLEALCDVGFEVTATYPIKADVSTFTAGETVSFDIVVVARTLDETEPISWNVLRRTVYHTARRTRTRLERNSDLSRGDIGVIEMGRCFQEYSGHHGKVRRDGELMSAKEVVEEIYGIVQDVSEIDLEDVFVELLDTDEPSFDDVTELCRGTDATPRDLREAHLYDQGDGFELGTWDNEMRQTYIQERVNGDDSAHLTDLARLQFLRYRYETGQAVQNYVDEWDVDDDLRELAGRLADATGDDAYTRLLGGYIG